MKLQLEFFFILKMERKPANFFRFEKERKSALLSNLEQERKSAKFPIVEGKKIRQSEFGTGETMRKRLVDSHRTVRTNLLKLKQKK